MKEKTQKGNSKVTNSRGPLYIIIALVVGVCTGIFFQYHYNMGEGILKLLVSKETLQRQRLCEVLKIKGRYAWDDVRIQAEKDYPSYKEQLLEFVDRKQDLRLSAYLLIPKSPSRQKFPAVLCIHGHHSTKEEVAGITPSKYNINYGNVLVEQNYIALIPEIRYSQDIWRLEDPMALNLILYGKSMTGERLKDLLRCVSYLKDHKLVDADKIGVVGWSMGGGLTTYLSAIDTRIKATYVSCYFGNYEQTIMAVRQSTDNYIPGIREFGEFYDVASLIAPRPLFIEHGSPDREFPVEVAKMAFEQVRNTYLKMGAQDRIQMFIGDGGHRFYGDQLIPWFNEYLKQN